MELIAINWTVLFIVGAILLCLLLFIIKRNRKDRKDLEDQLMDDYRKPKEAEHNDDPDDVKNS